MAKKSAKKAKSTEQKAAKQSRKAAQKESKVKSKASGDSDADDLDVESVLEGIYPCLSASKHCLKSSLIACIMSTLL